MVLPFVREVLADAEHSQSFQRAVTHLKGRAGRITLSGLTPAAKALHVCFLRRAISKPLIGIVAHNRAAGELLPSLRAFAELTGAVDPSQVLQLPAYDVLPFENLSPHPEIQEERAATLFKVAHRQAEIVVVPLESAAMRLQSAEFYAGLGKTVRRTDTLDPESLVQHLNIVGYTPMDLVDMPGQYALRGGILDVYPPDAERPLRIELFGDEVESIKRFDPDTQRASSPVDEAVLLPLSESPVTDELLGAIHARLSGRRLVGPQDDITDMVTAAGVSVFPGWELYAPIAAKESQQTL